MNARRQRAAILRQLGIRRAFDRDRQALRRWVSESCGRSARSVAEQMDAAYRWGLEQGFFVPSDKIMERLVRGGQHDFAETILLAIAARLSSETRRRLEASLSAPREPTGCHALKGDVGPASLANTLSVCDRLAFVEGLDLPFSVLDGIDPAWVRRLSRRVDRETASEMRRHSDQRRLGLYALYLMHRRSKMIDGLVDLLLDIVHRLQTRSRRKVVTSIAQDIERVHGKDRLLYDIANAAIAEPEGRVIDVIYPVAGAAKLKAVIDEHQAKGTLDRRIQTVMRGSYASHYRRMLPKLLSVLAFRSNNAGWHPILDAIALILRFGEEGRRFVPAVLAPKGSIPGKWRDLEPDPLRSSRSER